MSIYEDKKPSADEIKAKISELSDKPEEIRLQIAGLEEKLAAALVLGKGSEKIEGEILRLQNQLKVIPKSIELLFEELNEIKVDALHSEIKSQRRRINKVVKELEPDIIAVKEAVKSYLDKLTSLDLSGVQCQSKTAEEILKGISFTNPIERFMDETDGYLKHLERVRMADLKSA